MRRALALAALLLASGCARPQPAPAPDGVREVAGYLAGTTELSGEVLVTGDILVTAGSTLIVHPGTTLRIRAAEGTKIDPEYLSPATEILVRGTLQIRGTAAAPVRLVPELPGREVAWAGLLFDGGSGRVEGSEIERAEHGILCLAAAPQLLDNRIRGCRYGIVAQHGSAPEIGGNLLAAGEGGLYIWDGSMPQVRGNRIEGQAEEGLFVDAGSRPLLRDNHITGNDIGVVLGACDLPLAGNDIRGNREDLRCLAAERGGR